MWSLNGSLDEVMIFNRSLSSSEIAGLYANQSTRFLNLTYSNLTRGNHSVVAYTMDLAGNVNSSAVSFSVPEKICGDSLTGEFNLTYDLFSNNKTCLTFGADNIVLDCAGHSLTGDNNTDKHGIYSSGKNNITIKNCLVKDFDDGIRTYQTNDSFFYNNTAYGGWNDVDGHGFYFEGSSNNLIENNTGIANQGYGLGIWSSSNNNSVRNNLGISNSSSGRGIYFYNNRGNMVINNTGNCTYGPGIYLYQLSNYTLVNNTGFSSSSQGIRIESSTNNTFVTNYGQSSLAGGLLVTASNNNNFEGDYGKTLGSSMGFYLFNSASNNYLVNITGISNSLYGIYLYPDANNNTLINSTAYSSSYRALQIEKSDNNTIIGLNATVGDNTDQAVFFSNSTGNLISDCKYLSGGTDVYSTNVAGRSNENTISNCS
jgi:parallel beta-helix repeat protein